MIQAQPKANESPVDRLRARLAFLYGPDASEPLAKRIEALARQHRQKRPADLPAGEPWSERSAMLFAYADSLVAGGEAPLRTLRRFLRDHVGTRLSHVHLLPFYPFTSDDGFAVTDFRVVRPELGDWSDVRDLARSYRLVFDAVINHVSASSGYMRDYCAGRPEAEDFFVSLDPATDTSGVLRTRNLPLLHPYETVRGTRWLWTTFGPDQVDLNYANPEVLLEVLDVLLGYAGQGAAMLRLDAIPYLWKQLGTPCAHLPQTHEVIKLIRDVLDLACPEVQLLSETNCPHRENVTYLGAAGDEAQVIYNFTLAPLILHALVRGDAGILSEWARQVRPVGARATFLNITATHDGIGMRPTEGILPESERTLLCGLAEQRGAGITGKRNPDGSVSVYELNVTYFDALNDPASDEPQELQVRRFLLAQAITMAFVGIPGLYVHSLVGSRNDLEGVRRTGRARSVNRAQLDLGALDRELAVPTSLRTQVFSGILRLLAVRGDRPAFHPGAEQEVLDVDPGVFALVRSDARSGQRVLALHNVTARTLRVFHSRFAAFSGGVDGIGETVYEGGPLGLSPYQVCWISAKGTKA